MVPRWLASNFLLQKSNQTLRSQEGSDHQLKKLLIAGREIAPNTGANATKFFTLVTKSWKLVAKLATRTFHHNLTKRYSELKRFAKINPQQTSSLSLFQNATHTSRSITRRHLGFRWALTSHIVHSSVHFVTR